MLFVADSPLGILTSTEMPNLFLYRPPFQPFSGPSELCIEVSSLPLNNRRR